jgi:hypothetical protein
VKETTESLELKSLTAEMTSAAERLHMELSRKDTESSKLKMAWSIESEKQKGNE